MVEQGPILFIGGLEAGPILIGAVATLALTGGLATGWRFITGKAGKKTKGGE